MLQNLMVWFKSNGFMISVAAAVAVYNTAMSGVSLGLQKLDEFLKGVMDKTATDLDNKAEAKVSSLLTFCAKAVAFGQKLSDWFSANREHT